MISIRHYPDFLYNKNSGGISRRYMDALEFSDRKIQAMAQAYLFLGNVVLPCKRVVFCDGNIAAFTARKVKQLIFRN